MTHQPMFQWARRIVAYFSAICLGVLVATYAQADVLFENVRIFDGKSDTLSEPSNVLVRGNLIEEISLGLIEPLMKQPTR
jgi:hypothetical protein